MDFQLSDLDAVRERADRESRRAEAVRAELDAIEGKGESAEGKVGAVTDANGRLLSITIDPRALSMGSLDLSEEITLAVRRAQDDGETRRERVLNEALSDVPKTPEEILDQFQEISHGYQRFMDHADAKIDDIMRGLG
ncbi:YbaB/EbfC family nucleoid-associated protein [Nonomuraea sp. NPDC050536]|uniref:YbaB/EbfC family nucleoid-associated protein n=1 Tax=Nonomuraea sp. NPDC050536 TaxID=3364366 RepID=UPI0037C93688